MATWKGQLCLSCRSGRVWAAASPDTKASMSSVDAAAEAEIFVLASITSAAIIILKSGEASTRIVTVCGLQFWACSLNRFLAG